MRPSRRSLARLVVVGAVASSLAGCGLPTSGKVERVSPADVPFGLLESAPPGEGLQPTGPVVDVFFVRDDYLAAVAGHVVPGNVPANAVRLLLKGPPPSEAARGFSSDIPTGTRLVSLDLNGSVASVDLSAEFGSVGGSDQVLAVAQIVYTLTASRYIDAVVFAINGTRIEVPDGSGSLSATPMRRRDYPRLLSSG